MEFPLAGRHARLPLRIEPIAGFAPTIGRLVCILTHSRRALTAAVDGLSGDQLDHLHDAASNSIGALLAHAAAVEWWHQVLTFGAHVPSASEEAPWLAALDLGAAARAQIRGRDTESYLEALDRAREATLSALRQMDDDWLERPLVAMPERNAHWAWFHVAEDEISHAGQIRWLRARLPR
ncbi:mycothiol transferase [Paludibaculum fermentans]|uniref:DUF664 domain-containing protein n=1 Tax=Paludibaculum fermentans TaxID=1473598 RepID=A0A7S7NWB3_PALFE|nr:DUF664 domain-containing protein [Paludibaculum fermentans]QOY90972.1 DUF664 domain-containing protein [Paludibaculum fermentans]